MKAKVTLKTEIDFSEVIIGDYTLSEIFKEIYSRTIECVQNISLENQKSDPDFTDIDCPLHGVLNLIENIRGV